MWVFCLSKHAAIGPVDQGDPHLTRIRVEEEDPL
jgi:hypothetical protein